VDVPQATCAVVVLYHPETDLLNRLLLSTMNQVQRIYVIDNTSPSAGSKIPVQESEELHYLPLGRNAGLAAAQNVGLRQAIEDGFTHTLLLDQDSELLPGTVDVLLQAERDLLVSGQRVAAVGAMFVDTKTEIAGPAHRYHAFRLETMRVPRSSPPIESHWLIASGSLIRSSVLSEVGLMREDLFIDGVDTEWGLRARTLGWISFLIPQASMQHSIGDVGAKLLGRKVTLHNDIRACYMMRNNVYLMRVSTMGWRWRSGAPLRIAASLITSSLLAKDKMRRAQLLLWAVGEGLRGRLGPITP
jgi:rhamnosyltransferase